MRPSGHLHKPALIKGAILGNCRPAINVRPDGVAARSGGPVPAISDPKITPELVAAHGLKPDEYARILALIGRLRRSPNSAFSRRCGTSIALTNRRGCICAGLPTKGAVGHSGAGRKRRRHRHRRRRGLRLQDGEPQPPLLHRAVFRAPRPASAAFCATSSRWARVRSPA